MFFLFYRRSGFEARDGKWHQICVTWENVKGEVQFFKDGNLVKSSTDFKKGYTIKGGGSFVLGQEQDGLQQNFETEQSFRGSLTNVNVWSYVLSPTIIKLYARSCLDGSGNVYQWSDFINGIKGNTALVIPSPCTPS